MVYRDDLENKGAEKVTEKGLLDIYYLNGHYWGVHIACAPWPDSNDQVVRIWAARNCPGFEEIRRSCSVVSANLDDPVEMYDPTIHGPLQKRNFAISRGDRWEGMTESGQTVYLPLDHPQVQNFEREQRR